MPDYTTKCIVCLLRSRNETNPNNNFATRKMNDDQISIK